MPLVHNGTSTRRPRRIRTIGHERVGRFDISAVWFFVIIFVFVPCVIVCVCLCFCVLKHWGRLSCCKKRQPEIVSENESQSIRIQTSESMLFSPKTIDSKESIEILVHVNPKDSQPSDKHNRNDLGITEKKGMSHGAKNKNAKPETLAKTSSQSESVHTLPHVQFEDSEKFEDIKKK